MTLAVIAALAFAPIGWAIGGYIETALRINEFERRIEKLEQLMGALDRMLCDHVRQHPDCKKCKK
jgi:hypothetical protein